MYTDSLFDKVEFQEFGAINHEIYQVFFVTFNIGVLIR